MTKRPVRDPLILEIAAAIGAGRIEIGPIHDEREYVHGYAFPNGAVRLNPALSVVDSALHELTHRLRPTWSERAVRSRVTRMMKQMSYREIDKLYEMVLVQAKRTKVELV